MKKTKNFEIKLNNGTIIRHKIKDLDSDKKLVEVSAFNDKGKVTAVFLLHEPKGGKNGNRKS